jgi:hypothetical protein
MYWNARLGTSRFCSNADMNRRRGRSPALISGNETVKSSLDDLVTYERLATSHSIPNLSPL